MTESDVFERLLRDLRRGEAAADEAAVTLGLLIDRERTRRPAGDDGGLGELLEGEALRRRLTPAEISRTIDALTLELRTTARPRVSFIWVLEKTADPATVPVLLSVLERTMGDSATSEVACQAMKAAVHIAVDSRYTSRVAAVLEHAAFSGSEEVKESAATLLAHFDTGSG